MDQKKHIHDYLENVVSALVRLDREEVNNMASLIFEAYESDKQIFVLGNGGSASTASHFVCDLNKGVSYGRDKKIKAIALTDNMAIITAYSNDVSYDDIFVEQLKNFLNPGDLVIAISGSGNSKNVIRAIEYANSAGNMTLGLTGYGGGKLKQIAKFSVNANVQDMEISEDVHLSICHNIKRVLLNKINSA